MAEWYDLHQSAEGRKLLHGEPAASVAWLQPRSGEDLARMREAFEYYADRLGGGWVARGPDYMATVMLGLWDIRADLGGAKPEFRENLEGYYREARASGVSQSVGVGPAQIDASKPMRENEALRVVRETPGGVVVSGARWISTDAAVAEHFVTFPSGRFGPGMEDLALSFWLPVGTKGLRVLCREPMKGEASSPLARFEEVDALLEFREVLVPRENLFLARDAERASLGITRGLRWASWHTLVRQAVKAETFAGLAFLLADYTGLRELGSVQKELGELVVVAEGMRAFVTACERNCVYTPEGLAKPSPVTATAGRMFFLQSLPKLQRAVQSTGGSSLVMAPGESWWEGDGEALDALERMFRAREAGARKKARLFRLAWELACGERAARQALFEQFNFSHEYANLQELFHQYDAKRGTERVRRLAGLDRED
jgi:aromatic ring hydroxylase